MTHGCVGGTMATVVSGSSYHKKRHTFARPEMGSLFTEAHASVSAFTGVIS